MLRAESAVEMLSNNGSAYTARDTRVFARQLGLKPCFTPVRSPQSNGISEAFVHTLKRDYVHVSPLPDAATALTSLPPSCLTSVADISIISISDLSRRGPGSHGV